MLDIIGGTYLESCIYPISHEIYGSGLRAAIALANKDISLQLHTCIGKHEFNHLRRTSELFDFTLDYNLIDETIEFIYDYPLSIPEVYPEDFSKTKIGRIEADNILYYGLIETDVNIIGKNVVYDPQNHMSFRANDNVAEHLAIILNEHEAKLLSGCNSKDIRTVGEKVLEKERADVVVIKRGVKGAIVIEKNGNEVIPIYKTERVWPIGSGDIFSAVFAWQWIINRLTPVKAACIASKYTAYYCETWNLPLPADSHNSYSPVYTSNKKIYLAGPFFSMQEVYVINEFRKSLIELGIDVYSPYHESTLISQNSSLKEIEEVAQNNLMEIDKCDVMLANISGLDAGTLFEIGYAISRNKRVVIFAENINNEDLFMLKGSGCVITDDFSSAVYKSTWESIEHL